MASPISRLQALANKIREEKQVVAKLPTLAPSAPVKATPVAPEVTVDTSKEFQYFLKKMFGGKKPTAEQYVQLKKAFDSAQTKDNAPAIKWDRLAPGQEPPKSIAYNDTAARTMRKPATIISSEGMDTPTQMEVFSRAQDAYKASMQKYGLDPSNDMHRMAFDRANKADTLNGRTLAQTPHAEIDASAAEAAYLLRKNPDVFAPKKVELVHGEKLAAMEKAYQEVQAHNTKIEAAKTAKLANYEDPNMPRGGKFNSTGAKALAIGQLASFVPELAYMALNNPEENAAYQQRGRQEVLRGMPSFRGIPEYT